MTAVCTANLVGLHKKYILQNNVIFRGKITQTASQSTGVITHFYTE